jgi:hypothetical protein
LFIASFKPDITTFTNLFKTYLNNLQIITSKSQNTQLAKQKLNLSTLEFIEMSDISNEIDDDYYFSLLQRLVYNILLFFL